jgi:NAD-dependent deacetylase sirtuin 2
MSDQPKKPPPEQNGSNHETPAASAAASTSTASGDATMAQVLHTIEALTTLFNFSSDAANEAVQEVGTEIQECVNYILDKGLGTDTGGAIYPIYNCPHVSDHIKINASELPKDPHQLPCGHFAEQRRPSTTTNSERAPARLKGEEDVDDEGPPESCPIGENWLCLECGSVRCSRYVNGHGLHHWEDTKTDENPYGHCIAVSLADLSVWCHLCSAYLKHPTLQPLVQQLEQMKFPDDDNSNCNNHAHEPETKRRRSSMEDLESADEEDDHYRKPSPARGVPLKLGGDDDDDDDDDNDGERSIDYPFEPPTSLADVAKFIQSDQCRSILVLAGAGMSVRSGIPDFRSANGLYATMNADLLTADPLEREAIRIDPSVALEQPLFLKNPLPCLELNRSFILGTRDQKWKATLAHRFVELLHTKTNKLSRLYTQNIDGLEDQCTQLPREKVVNVHGSMDRAECAMCQSEADFDEFCNQVQTQIKDLSGDDPTAPQKSTAIACPVCGYNTMKPAIVLFKSTLPERFFELVPRDIPFCDLMIVMGTSLRVAPANTLVFRVPETAMRTVINRDPVGFHSGIEYGPGAPRDYFAQGDIDPTCLELMTLLGWLEDLEPLLSEDLLPDSSADLLRERLEKEQARGQNE